MNYWWQLIIRTQYLRQVCIGKTGNDCGHYYNCHRTEENMFFWRRYEVFHISGLSATGSLSVIELSYSF